MRFLKIQNPTQKYFSVPDYNYSPEKGHHQRESPSHQAVLARLPKSLGSFGQDAQVSREVPVAHSPLPPSTVARQTTWWMLCQHLNNVQIGLGHKKLFPWSNSGVNCYLNKRNQLFDPRFTARSYPRPAPISHALPRRMGIALVRRMEVPHVSWRTTRSWKLPVKQWGDVLGWWREGGGRETRWGQFRPGRG